MKPDEIRMKRTPANLTKPAARRTRFAHLMGNAAAADQQHSSALFSLHIKAKAAYMPLTLPRRLIPRRLG